MFLVGIFHSWLFKGAFGWNQTDSKCFSSGLYIGIIYAAHRSEWHHCQGRRQVMVKMDSGLTAVVCPPGVDTAVFLHPAQGRWGKVEEKNQQKGAQRIKPGFQKLLRSYTRKKKENACLAPTMIYVLCPQGGRAFSDTVWSPWAGLPGRFVWKPTGVGPLPTLSQWWIQQEKKRSQKWPRCDPWGVSGFGHFLLPSAKPDFFRSEDRFLTPKHWVVCFCVFFWGGEGKKGTSLLWKRKSHYNKLQGNAWKMHRISRRCMMFFFESSTTSTGSWKWWFPKEISLSRATGSASTFGFWVFNFDSTLDMVYQDSKQNHPQPLFSRQMFAFWRCWNLCSPII